jgi:cellulose synthase/poly-beta-1,6-N-acetylglucosamine synthase-like glycosyltransferase
MLTLFEVIAYVCWFIIIYIGVVWVLVFLQNNEKIIRVRKLLPVSILVPAYNEEDHLAKTIRSLLDLKYPKELKEIIVIDDGSTDRTYSIAKKFPVKVLRNKDNRGKAYSLNKGLKHAKGDIVVCMDADSFVERDALLKTIPYFYDKEVGAVTGALKVWEPKTFLEKIQDAEYILNILLRKILTILDSVPVTPGPFSLYRKDVLNDVGGFDENNMTEDMEIALKIHGAGYRIENSPDTEVFTVCPNKVRDLFKQRLRWYRGVLYNSRKYKYMFFNKTYGNLGLFFLPMTLASIFVVGYVFFTVMWELFSNIFNTLRHFFLIKFDIGPFFSFNFDLNIFSINSTILFSIISIVLGSFLLYTSFKFSNEKIRENKLGFISYLFLFPFMLTFVWIISIIYELRGVKSRW